MQQDIIEDEDDLGECEPELWIYDLCVLNERLPSGRVLLASCDIRVFGICIIGCCLMLDIKGELRISPPRATGRRREKTVAIQFKSKGLRDRITAKCLATYRELAAEDWTQPERQRARAA